MERLHLVAEFFKALANPSRIQILNELRHGELNVSELRNRLNMELPNVSQQLAVLRSQRLVLARKHRCNIYYSCLNHEVFEILDSVDSLLTKAGSTRHREL
ncbi:MAG TPA: metalloregulator ArsR/SmtB family transcription factor [Trichormus sp.]|jgi:ArsR family transcriptional regulator